MQFPSPLIFLVLVALLQSPLEAQNRPAGARERIEQHRKGEVTLDLKGPSGEPLPAGTPVRVEQLQHEFLFGCNLFALGRVGSEEEDQLYRRQFAEIFNFATLPFYWWTYERREGESDRDRIAQMLKFCQKHEIRVKGHPMAWNFADPDWLPADPETAYEKQMDRIEALAREYRQQIGIWDVVNEATDFEREETLERAPVLTRSIRSAGRRKYLRDAFRRARMGNPEAILLINDYRTGIDYAEKVLDPLTSPRGKTLYDAIGIQSHQHRGAWGAETTWETADRFSSYGVPLHFTETTFLSGELGWELARHRPGFVWSSRAAEEFRQAAEVEEFYRTLFSHPSVEAITWWDFADRGAWQRAPAGLLREDLSPKPAYQVLERLIKQEWWTIVGGTAAADGRFELSGFYGEYLISAEIDRGRLTARFRLERGTPERLDVRLR